MVKFARYLSVGAPEALKLFHPTQTHVEENRGPRAGYTHGNSYLRGSLRPSIANRVRTAEEIKAKGERQGHPEIITTHKTIRQHSLVNMMWSMMDPSGAYVGISSFETLHEGYQ